MTDKLISLQAAKTALSSCTILEWEQLKKCYPMLEVLEELPSAQPTQTNTSKALETLDCISRRAAIAKFEPWLKVEGYSEGELNMLKAVLFELTVMPPAVSSSRSHENDLIGRQAAIDEVSKYASIWMEYDGGMTQEEVAEAALKAAKRTMVHILEELPSAQPERTCVNCGRTVNNGGWYADGRTRCPIEEHYALPKDGFCHLWEKRNVTDDDYPEGRADE